LVNRPFRSQTRPCRISKGIDGKDCEHRITDEFEHIAAVRLDSLDNGLEEIVEHREELCLVD
jgi:hypothetical protein